MLWPSVLLHYTWRCGEGDGGLQAFCQIASSSGCTCNGLPVEHVDTFKYLGLHFHTSGGIPHLIAPLKATAAWSWGVVQQRHSQLQCGHTTDLILS